MNSREKGRKGEAEAERYLVERGYRILNRNYATSKGEVDIIAQKEETLSFIEVKTWEKLGESDLEYAIGPNKQKKIINVSKDYLWKNGWSGNSSVSYDVLFIDDSQDRIRHIQGAFDGV